ncbi:MAG: hypothetical protein KGI37_07220 [Alphaproteobacteria bacterium]|nr:hypothetical protein [Alphaproteobacteria bacterium]
MNDQGEKIVFLAREILNAGIDENHAAVKKTRVTMSFTTLCLTTFLAASGGAVVGHMVQNSHRPLNRYEKTEIDALVFYTARLKGISEDILRQDVAGQVGAPNYDDIDASEFAAARTYLQKKAQ